MTEPSWLYPLVISIEVLIAVLCNMGIAFIIGYEEGKRRSKRPTLIFEVTEDGHSATPTWTKLPRELIL